MRLRPNPRADEPAADEVIEFEFGAADVPDLSPASAPPSAVAETAAAHDPAQPTKTGTRGRQTGAYAMALLLVAIGGITYRSMTSIPADPQSSGPASVAMQSTEPAAVTEVAQQESPVRVKNPFDASEVFEFPPGTSRTRAREMVQAVLLQRARERESQWRVVKHRNKQRAAGGGTYS